MASVALEPPRPKMVVGYPPLSEMGDLQRREFQEALLEADSFEDLPGVPLVRAAVIAGRVRFSG